MISDTKDYTVLCKTSMVSDTVVLIFIVALPALVSVSASEAHCGQQYQAALQEVLRLKEKCGLAAFYDCCQVCRQESIVHYCYIFYVYHPSALAILRWLIA